MIAIIDYGMGNLRSVSKAFEAVGHQAVVTRDPRVIGNASHVVLPGVGAFGDCMANVERYGLAEPIRTAIQSGKPFLGICLGFQLLFEESEEFGTHKGLGIIPARSDDLLPTEVEGAAHGLEQRHDSSGPVRCSKGLPTESYWYFVHSFYVDPSDEDRCGNDDGLRDDVCVEYLAGQCGGLSVPSRKESGRRVTIDQKFWILA